jgi:hypothetical protein
MPIACSPVERWNALGSEFPLPMRGTSMPWTRFRHQMPFTLPILAVCPSFQHPPGQRRGGASARHLAGSISHRLSVSRPRDLISERKRAREGGKARLPIPALALVSASCCHDWASPAVSPANERASTRVPVSLRPGIPDPNHDDVEAGRTAAAVSDTGSYFMFIPLASPCSVSRTGPSYPWTWNLIVVP